MSALRFARAACVVAVVCAVASSARAQEPFADAAAITQFQRSVDTYAFEHRQVERRVGAKADQKAMAYGMRAARPSAADGDIFTPLVSAAFRARIAMALRTNGCSRPDHTGTSFAVPRVGEAATDSSAVPACVARVLPHLPAELEYRVAGVTLVLLDTHANLVVDVLHGAFPG